MSEGPRTRRILVLEDNDARIKMFAKFLHGNLVTFATTSISTIQLLDQGRAGVHFDWLFLDHDLGDETMCPSGPGTGYEVALWLAMHPEKMPPNIVLHTYNTAGMKNMKDVLEQAGARRVICAPGIWLKEVEWGED